MKTLTRGAVTLCFLGQTLLPVSVTGPQYAHAEQVCISPERATDLIQILDASDRNLQLLESCNALVDQLYAEIELRDHIIENLTKENIELKQEVRRLKKKRDREKVLRYAGIAGIIFAVVKVAAAVAAI